MNQKGTADLAPDNFGVRGGQLDEIENFVAYDRLLNEINGLLFYPPALGRREISGTINARLSFRERKCDWQKSRILGAQPYLRIYILTLLKKLCALENLNQLRLADGQFVDLSFSFIVGDVPENPPERHDRIVGNVLLFERVHAKPTGSYQLGPIRGLWFAPAVTLDFPWVFEKYEQLVNGVDPLDAFREP